ncbi:uncharacterized protein LOC122320331 [Drosophila ficusphila]|uniref:uncharacterized protein LOC122320331 n=1 Tax=Drosophila ficusphila TaxID=30025 RepID=UPI001C892F89|nr:uncharacterized protein LOC122320331 [Drosophila ficusphila]
MLDICHLGTKYRAHALIDSGSEATFISERLFRLLKLPFRPINAKVSGLNQTVSAQSTRQCHFAISSPSKPGLQLNTAAYVLPELAGNFPSCPIPKDELSGLPNLPLADPTFSEVSKIAVLIGADILRSVLLSGTRTNICGSLLGQETIFGWVLTGPVSSTPNHGRVSAFTTQISETADKELNKLLTKFWEVEDLPIKMVKEPDSYCESNFRRTTTRDQSGKYVITLPFRDPEHSGSSLGYSRSIELAQFLRNENRLKRDFPLKEQYDSVIQEYLDQDHMRQVPPTQDTPSYYLPHHAVIKSESTTTKLRVVFNASSPSANGTSLNDVLHAGPVLQSDLTIQILKWRFFQYVFSADITKMYRQIWVNPKHTPFQRILFRNMEGELRDYELRSIAPLFWRSESSNNWQVMSKFSFQGLAILFGSTCTSTMKWTSNHKEVLKDIPSVHRLHNGFLEIDADSSAQTLGIRWEATSDEFFFVPPVIGIESSYTKREVLSQIAKLFDPAGWLAPFIVRSKMFMQEIWLQELGWDEKLPNEMSQKWQEFLRSYSDLNKIRIPRWNGYNSDVRIEHHGFCDASQKACRLSRLLVEFIHQISLHGGNQLMIRLIRAKYWVPKLKNLVKAAGSSCKVCIILKKRLQSQLIGDLPTDRVSFMRPFTYTGIENEQQHCYPVISCKRSRSLRWVHTAIKGFYGVSFRQAHRIWEACGKRV